MQNPQDFRTATLVSLLICTAQDVHANRIMGSCQSCITASPTASNASVLPAANSSTPTAAGDGFFDSTWVAPVTYLLAFYDIASVLLLVQRFLINYVGYLLHRWRDSGNECTSDNSNCSGHPPIGKQHDRTLIGVPMAGGRVNSNARSIVRKRHIILRASFNLGEKDLYKLVERRG